MGQLRLEMERNHRIVIMKRIAFFIGFLALLASCNQGPQKMVLQGEAQGSYYAITYYDEQGRNFQQEIDSIFHAVAR